MHTLKPSRDTLGSARRTKINSLALALATVIGIAIASGSAFGSDPPYTFKVITTIGSPAPGGGVFGNDFEPTGLNNWGQLAFTAEPDAPFGVDIFLAGSGGISNITCFA